MKKVPSRQKPKGLTKQTHTKKRVLRPIVITVNEWNLICFQPQEGIQLYFVKEDIRIRSRIIKYTLFLSFHITQTQASQVTLKKEWEKRACLPYQYTEQNDHEAQQRKQKIYHAIAALEAKYHQKWCIQEEGVPPSQDYRNPQHTN